MRVIIHDLDAAYNGILQAKCHQLIHANGKYAGCQGCFSCWTKHPAECFIHDSLCNVCRMVGKADELWIISENCYGMYSPFVKTIMDRSIGLSTPLSTYRGGQMHHTLRYGKRDLMKVYVYGDILEEEQSTFELIAERNAINYGFRNWQIIFAESREQLMGVLK